MGLRVKVLHQPKYLQTFQEDGKVSRACCRFKFHLLDTTNWVLTLEDVPCGTTILLENVLLDLVKVVLPRWVGMVLCLMEVVNVLGPSLGVGSASLLPVPPPLPEVGAWRMKLSRFALLMDADGCLDLAGRTGRWSWGILLPLE